MIEYTISPVAAVVMLPAAVVAFAAAWRRGMAATSAIAVRPSAHSLVATRVSTGDVVGTKFGPQSRGSSG